MSGWPTKATRTTQFTIKCVFITGLSASHTGLPSLLPSRVIGLMLDISACLFHTQEVRYFACTVFWLQRVNLLSSLDVIVQDLETGMCISLFVIPIRLLKKKENATPSSFYIHHHSEKQMWFYCVIDIVLKLYLDFPYA